MFTNNPEFLEQHVDGMHFITGLHTTLYNYKGKRKKRKELMSI
jgi:hypothetical protein